MDKRKLTVAEPMISETVLALCKEEIDFDRHIPYCLVRTVNLMQEATIPKYLQALTDTAPLLVREYRVLMLLSEYNPLSPARAAELTGMNRGTITRAITQLQRYDLVNILKNSRDGRGKFLIPTPKGATLCDKIIPMMREHGKFLEESFTSDEKDLFISLLQKIRERSELLRDAT